MYQNFITLINCRVVATSYSMSRKLFTEDDGAKKKSKGTNRPLVNVLTQLKI